MNSDEVDKLKRIKAILDEDYELYTESDIDYDGHDEPLGIPAPRTTATIKPPASATLTLTATTTKGHCHAQVVYNDLLVESIAQSYEMPDIRANSIDDSKEHFDINLLAPRELVLALQQELTDDT